MKSKNRTCRICKVKKPFEQMRYTNCNKAYCSAECGAQLAMYLLERKAALTEKNKRKEIKQRKEKLDETIPNWTKKAQKEFNKFIRYRDRDRACISCNCSSVRISGGYKGSGGWDAGHYRSTGSSPELRFHPWNCHKQCVECNRWESGNAVDYRINLIKRIGEQKVRAIERHVKPRKYTVDDLKSLHKYYKELNKIMSKKYDSN